MQKYTLFTWPESQEFVSNPLCHLVCPLENDDTLHLDSSYLVPIEEADPVGKEKIYIKLDEAESQKWLDMTGNEDNVLFDYDGHAFVEESLYNSCKMEENINQKISHSVCKASYDVCFVPMTNVEVLVHDPLHPTEEELTKICAEAAIKILDNSESYMTEENVISVELYDKKCGSKTTIFNTNPASIDEALKNIMSLKKQIGEFSVDLYYNNFDKENPYTAKLHSVIDKNLNYHARAKSFSDAINDIRSFIQEKWNV